MQDNLLYPPSQIVAGSSSLGAPLSQLLDPEGGRSISASFRGSRQVRIRRTLPVATCGRVERVGSSVVAISGILGGGRQRVCVAQFQQETFRGLWQVSRRRILPFAVYDGAKRVRSSIVSKLWHPGRVSLARLCPAAPLVASSSCGIMVEGRRLSSHCSTSRPWSQTR